MTNGTLVGVPFIWINQTTELSGVAEQGFAS